MQEDRREACVDARRFGTLRSVGTKTMRYVRLQFALRSKTVCDESKNHDRFIFTAFSVTTTPHFPVPGGFPGTTYAACSTAPEQSNIGDENEGDSPFATRCVTVRSTSLQLSATSRCRQFVALYRATKVTMPTNQDAPFPGVSRSMLLSNAVIIYSRSNASRIPGRAFAERQAMPRFAACGAGGARDGTQLALQSCTFPECSRTPAAATFCPLVVCFSRGVAGPTSGPENQREPTGARSD